MKTSRHGYAIGDEPIPGYRLVSFLGEGGFGEVWKVTAPGGTPAALKIVDLGTRQGQKEFRALAQVKELKHPNLVPISAFWLKDAEGRVLEEAELGEVFAELKPRPQKPLSETLMVPRYALPLELIIAMGLGEKSLAKRLAECHEQGLAGIPAAELLRYMEDAARAIDHLVNSHGKHDTALGGVSHGDIKPLNILIVGDGAQVCDFGLARVLTDNRKTAMAYTPTYVAPEVIDRKDPSAAADQYALAVSYVELRTGRLPFPEDFGRVELEQAHRTGALDLSALAPAERAVIAKASARDPASRFPSASAMAQALREAFEHRSPPPKRPPRRFLATAGAAAAVVVAAVVLYTIKPAVESVQTYLPSGFREVEGAEYELVNNTRWAKKIVCARPDLVEFNVQFVLVPRGRNMDPFYIMEDKVWNALFAHFVEKNQGMVGESWQQGAVKHGGPAGDSNTAANGRLPVLNVTLKEAALFADWLGGHLPTAKQWDKAAGALEDDNEKRGRLAPYNGDWNVVPRPDVAVDLADEGPRDVGDAKNDVSPFLCHDMSGNGLEWTCTNGRGIDVGLSDLWNDLVQADTLIQVRGRSYDAQRPLWYSDLDVRRGYSLPRQAAGEGSPYTGFRVVFDDLPNRLP